MIDSEGSLRLEDLFFVYRSSAPESLSILECNGLTQVPESRFLHAFKLFVSLILLEVKYYPSLYKSPTPIKRGSSRFWDSRDG
jgi:hypothetical protein